MGGNLLGISEGKWRGEFEIWKLSVVGKDTVYFLESPISSDDRFTYMQDSILILVQIYVEQYNNASKSKFEENLCTDTC